jgi:archaellum biogenesis ATPase FlaH
MVIEAQTMTNSDFLAEVLGELAPGTHGWVCTFRADPNKAPPDVWSGRAYSGRPQQAAVLDRADGENTYFSTAILRATDDGEVVRKKEAFVRLAVLVLDDVQLDDVKAMSYAIQTSPGKFQVGILLDPEDQDTYNRQLVDRTMSSLAARGRTNDASGNACVRYVRLPVGSNTKPRPAGVWRVQLELWQPNVRWSLADACDAVGIDLEALRITATLPKAAATAPGQGSKAGEMLASLMQPQPHDRAYHDSLTRLAASLIAGGMFPGAAVELLYSLMDQIRPHDHTELQRWQSRRDEIPRAVRSAEQFAPPERQPPQITVNLNAPATPPTPGDPQPMDWEALADQEPQPATWRLDGWLPDKTTTLLSAHGGVGKSNVSLQLAVALAHGEEFLGIQTRQSRVLVLSGEDAADTVHFRVANVCRDMGVDLRSLHNRLHVYDLTQQDCVLWREGGATSRMQWLVDQAVRTRADVIMVDNASDVFMANENDRAEVRGFLRALNLLASATGAAILLLAHVDKASARAGAGLDTNTTFSGSTAWNNSARSRWAMVREDNGSVLLRHEKCNFGALQEEVKLEFDLDAKVFRRFGHIPGQAAARALVASQQRLALLRLLAEAGNRNARLSMAPKANNNAYLMLRDEPAFPQVDRAGFFSLLMDLQRDGLVHEVEYFNEHRKRHRAVELTEVGRLRVAQGSGAAAMWRGQAQGQVQGQGDA